MFEPELSVDSAMTGWPHLHGFHGAAPGGRSSVLPGGGAHVGGSPSPDWVRVVPGVM